MGNPCKGSSPLRDPVSILRGIYCFLTGGGIIAAIQNSSPFCTTDNGPCWQTRRGVGEDNEPLSTTDATTGAACTGAPAAGKALRITDIIISSGGVQKLTFTEDVGNSVIMVINTVAGFTANIVTRGALDLPIGAKLVVTSDNAEDLSVQTLYYDI